MANITDNELRGIALQVAYKRRGEGVLAWSNDDFKDLDQSVEFDIQDLLRISEQLAQHGLFWFKPLSNGLQILDGRFKITAFGVDVIEGHVKPPIAITFDMSKNVTVTGSSNVQVGDSNIQGIAVHLESLMREIDGAEGSEAEKAEAKSRLRGFLEHPIVAAIVGGLASNVKP